MRASQPSIRHPRISSSSSAPTRARAGGRWPKPPVLLAHGGASRCRSIIILPLAEPPNVQAAALPPAPQGANGGGQMQDPYRQSTGRRAATASTGGGKLDLYFRISRRSLVAIPPCFQRARRLRARPSGILGP